MKLAAHDLLSTRDKKKAFEAHHILIISLIVATDNFFVVFAKA